MIFAMHDPLADLLGEWSRTEYRLGAAAHRAGGTARLGDRVRALKQTSLGGLRTFVLVSFASTVSMLLDVYLMSNFGARLPILSAATVIAAALVSGNAILFSSRSQIKGLTTSTGLWACSILGFAIGAGLYTVTGSCFSFFLCILACFPAFEQYLKNRSNHFEIHLELKNSGYLRDFVTVSRRLGLRIDDIEANQAYAGSGLSVFTVTFTICSAELKKYKTHREIIEALSSLDYIYHIEEMR